LLQRRLRGGDGRNGIPVPKTMDIRGTLALLLFIFINFHGEMGGYLDCKFSTGKLVNVMEI
jgi:hypothetical protein